VTAIPISTEKKEKARFVLTENDPITRKVIGMMLQKSNFDIAENGLQAVGKSERAYRKTIMRVFRKGILEFKKESIELFQHVATTIRWYT
jgi:hypothetical protein